MESVETSSSLDKKFFMEVETQEFGDKCGDDNIGSPFETGPSHSSSIKSSKAFEGYCAIGMFPLGQI